MERNWDARRRNAQGRQDHRLRYQSQNRQNTVVQDLQKYKIYNEIIMIQQ